MNKLIRKAILLLTITFVFLGNIEAIQASAITGNEQKEIVLRYSNIEKFGCTLDVRGGSAYWDVTIRGNAGTTMISADVKLQKFTTMGTLLSETYIGEYVAQTGELLASGGPIPVTSGYIYILVVDAEVTRNGSVETARRTAERYY